MALRSSNAKILAKSLHDVADYLDTAFSASNGITNIYLGLDPLAIWEAQQ
ncbi:hypothetical protein [Waltera sp.]